MGGGNDEVGSEGEMDDGETADREMGGLSTGPGCVEVGGEGAVDDVSLGTSPGGSLTVTITSADLTAGDLAAAVDLEDTDLATAAEMAGAKAGGVEAAGMEAAGGYASGEGPGLVDAFSGGGGFHHWLLDMLPQPIFVRAASGALLFSNAAAATALGMPTGSTIEGWQVTPQVVALDESACSVTDTAGEADLPRGGLPTSLSLPALPAPTERHPVLLQHSGTGTGDDGGDDGGSYGQLCGQQTLLHMARTPFWIVDGSGARHALVLYVG